MAMLDEFNLPRLANQRRLRVARIGANGVCSRRAGACQSFLCRFPLMRWCSSAEMIVEPAIPPGDCSETLLIMATVGTLSSSEEAQLTQTIEMFEVITQSQPQDYQSLEILREAYVKLCREKDVINTSKRIANAYVLMGQLSSAILEYESILQKYPDDPDATAALAEIESKAGGLNANATSAPST